MICFNEDITIYFGKLNSLPHRHYALEIIIGVNSTLISTHINKELKPAKAFLVLPNYEHQFFLENEEGEKIVILVDAGILFARTIISKFGLKEKKIMELDYSSIESFVKTIFILKDSAEKDNGEALSQCLIEFVSHLSSPSPIITPLDDRVLHAKKYVEENIHDKNIDFSELAKKVCLSESRLAHLFKNETGIPFRKYVLWIRLKTAIGLVKNNNSITQSAYIAGFSDSAHFSKVYSETFGLKPSLPLLDYKR